MSAIIDNITLAILSLKYDISEYLNDNDWRSNYSIALAGDPTLRGKELVVKAEDRSRQIQLPLIAIGTGQVRNISYEIGNSTGYDEVVVTISIIAVDDNQLRTLGNLLRRRLDGLVFDVYDFRSANKVAVGSATLADLVLDDISDWNSAELSERHVALVHATMEITAESLIE
ncbi:hypothetical protein M0R04_05760 [Candidatus Dojkabacteria bacterium]|jgi:hypothetical protein|nr:hypothetical protein [Candidatus Dojkabacteria bacterium]